MKIDGDAVAFQRRCCRRYLYAILAAGDILLLQFLLGLFEHRAVKNPGFGQTGLFQAFLQLVFFKFLRSDNADLGDCWPLFHHHEQHAVIRLEPHILEEPGCIKCLDCGGGLFVIERVANLNGQVTEDGTCLRTLYAFNPYVFDYKRFPCP